MAGSASIAGSPSSPRKRDQLLKEKMSVLHNMMIADRIVSMVDGRIKSNVLVREAALICEFLRGFDNAPHRGCACLMNRRTADVTESGQSREPRCSVERAFARHRRSETHSVYVTGCDATRTERTRRQLGGKWNWRQRREASLPRAERRRPVRAIGNPHIFELTHVSSWAAGDRRSFIYGFMFGFFTRRPDAFRPFFPGRRTPFNTRSIISSPIFSTRSEAIPLLFSTLWVPGVDTSSAGVLGRGWAARRWR